MELAETEPLALLPLLGESVRRVLGSAGALDERQLREPSLLPDWSRAHVLAHMAGSAESRVRLLTAARTGLPIPQYADEEARAQQIAADASLPAAELLGRLRSAAAEVLAAIRDHPADAWHNRVRWLGGTEAPVYRVLPSLLQELEIHHVDLRAGYGPEDWPDWFAAGQCRRAVADFARDERMPGLRIEAVDADIQHDFGRGGPLVSGPCRDLLAWLIGRGAGQRLTVTPPGPLPEPPPWRQ